MLQVISVLLLISISETYAKDHFPKILTKNNPILAQQTKEYAYEGNMVGKLPVDVREEEFLGLNIKFSPKDGDGNPMNINFSLESQKSKLKIEGDLINYSLELTKGGELKDQKVSMIIDGVTYPCIMDATINFDEQTGKKSSFMQKNQRFESEEIDLSKYIPKLNFISVDCDFTLNSTSVKLLGSSDGLKWWAWFLIVLAIIIVQAAIGWGVYAIMRKGSEDDKRKKVDPNTEVRRKTMPILVDPHAPQLDAFNPNINQPQLNNQLTANESSKTTLKPGLQQPGLQQPGILEQLLQQKNSQQTNLIQQSETSTQNGGQNSIQNNTYDNKNQLGLRNQPVSDVIPANNVHPVSTVIPATNVQPVSYVKPFSVANNIVDNGSSKLSKDTYSLPGSLTQPCKKNLKQSQATIGQPTDTKIVDTQYQNTVMTSYASEKVLNSKDYNDKYNSASPYHQFQQGQATNSNKKNSKNTNKSGENYITDNQIIFEPLENQVIPEVWSEYGSLKPAEDI